MNNEVWVNVTLAERCLRAIVAIVLILYFLLFPVVPLHIAFAGLVSLYLLLTSLVSWDPIYALFYKVAQVVFKVINVEDKSIQRELEFAA